MDDMEIRTSLKKGGAARFYATKVLHLGHTIILIVKRSRLDLLACQHRNLDNVDVRKDRHYGYAGPVQVLTPSRAFTACATAPGRPDSLNVHICLRQSDNFQ